MNVLRRKSGRSPIAISLAALVAGALLVLSVQSANAIEIMREVKPKAQQQQNGMMGQFPEDVLDQWLFNGQAKFSTARGKLEKKLTAKLTAMLRHCKVTEEQREKLTLAGVGDIQMFMRECEKIQRGFDPTDQNQVNNIWQELQPLRNQWNGDLFGPTSLFARAQTNCLTEEQFVEITRRERENREFAVETSIRRMIVELDQSAPLTIENRDKLTALLIEEIPVPIAMESAQQKQMAMQYVLYSCSNVPEKKIKPLLDEDGWRIFRQAIRNTRGLKQHFRQMGMIK